MFARRRPIPVFPVFFSCLAASLLAATGGCQAYRRLVGVAAEDLDQDPLCPDCTDVVIGDRGNRAVSVRFGQGDGTFANPVNLPTAGPVLAIAVADGDADGDSDVIASMSGAQSLTVFVNQTQEGDPQEFIAQSAFPLRLAGAKIVVARDAGGSPLDLNGDSLSDVALVLRGKEVMTLLGDGDCHFPAPITVLYDKLKITGLAAGDIDDSDGTDLVVSDRRAHRVLLLSNDGTGLYPNPNEFGVGEQPTAVVAADVNGNGTLDLIVPYAKNQFSPTGLGVGRLLGDGLGGFGAANLFGAGGLKPIAAAVDHFTPGTDPDVLVVNQRDQTIGFLENQGLGSFGPPITSSIGGGRPVSLAVADFDDDGQLDVVVANRSAVSICAGDGAGAFTCVPLP